LREVCEKHDKFYQRRRACIEKVRGSVKLFIAFPFVLTCYFVVHLFYMTIFELVFGFWSFSCA
jgi:hypothetical protein